MIRLAALFTLIWTCAGLADTVRLAVTTSFHNSGLSDVLLPAIAEDTGIEVQLLVVGTGQALRLGRSGDVDAILVHSKAAEETFVAEGYGTHRSEIMYNDFVLVGPAADPAGIASATDAGDALLRVAQAQSPFVSRGDDSGTHRKERALWQAAGQAPDDLGAWYNEVGAGMGASLNTAAGLGAYILTDRASWLNFGNKSGLNLLFSGDPVLFNQYGFLPVNPQRHSHVNAGGVERLEAWLTGAKAEALINGYTIEGQPLFVFNARPSE